MSIVTTAPAAFAYQDAVCSTLALLILDSNQGQCKSLIVEPTQGEDARLSNIGDRALEIQVKQFAGPFTASELAQVVMHFPARLSTNPLLQQLLHAGARLAVVTSADLTTELAFARGTLESLLLPGSPKPPSRECATSILSELRATLAQFGKTRLDIERADALRSIINGIDSGTHDLRSALSRITIVPSMDRDRLSMLAQAALFRLLVPSDRTARCIVAVENAIALKKTTDQDVVPEAARIVAQFADTSTMPHLYASRPEEPSLLESLSHKGILLLSGVPRCGKTSIARSLAAAHQKLGFQAHLATDVLSAERILTDASRTQQLVILDDPLGNAHSVDNPASVLSRLKHLVSILKGSSRLIVTQSQDRLFEAFGQFSLGKCRIGRHDWIDLSSPTSELLISAWRISCPSSISPSLSDQFTDLLRSRPSSFTLGAIGHLAANADHLLDNAELQDLQAIAAEDSNVYGRTLAQAEARTADIMRALSACTAHGTSLSPEDLAHVLQSIDSDPPWIRPGASLRVYSLLPEPLEDVRFPTYGKVVLDDANREALRRLERRRVVNRHMDAIQFSHSFYRAAADCLVTDELHYGLVPLADLLRRALWGLNPAMARSAARNLSWLYHRLPSDSSERPTLLKVAEDGLRSLFPGARDICLVFLLKHIDVFPFARGQSADSWLHRIDSTDNFVHWHGDEAWLPLSESSPQVAWFAESISGSDLNGFMARLRAGQPLAPRAVTSVLQHLSNHLPDLTPTDAQRLLLVDEASLRGEAARLWFAIPRKEDASIQETILRDPHPRVLLGAYDGLIESWSALPAQQRDHIFDLWASALANDRTALLLAHRLVVFDRVEYTGASPPWELFALLLPLVLEALPADPDRFSTPRLWASCLSSIHQIPSLRVAVICHAWLSWLRRVVAAGYSPDDYTLGVVDCILAMAPCPDRTALLKGLLELDALGPRVAVVASLVDSWKDLAYEEREALLSVVRDSADTHSLIRASAVTRSYLPPEVAEAVVPTFPDWPSHAPAELLDRLAPDLIHQCIELQRGEISILCRVGVRGRSQLWDDLMLEVACRPTHPDFELQRPPVMLTPY